jgi:hypothetical protein
MKKDCGKQGCLNDHPGLDARPWQRGDRISATSANGPNPTWAQQPLMTAFEGKADLGQGRAECQLLTLAV